MSSSSLRQKKQGETVAKGNSTPDAETTTPPPPDFYVNYCAHLERLASIELFAYTTTHHLIEVISRIEEIIKIESHMPFKYYTKIWNEVYKKHEVPQVLRDLHPRSPDESDLEDLSAIILRVCQEANNAIQGYGSRYFSHGEHQADIDFNAWQNYFRQYVASASDSGMKMRVCNESKIAEAHLAGFRYVVERSSELKVTTYLGMANLVFVVIAAVAAVISAMLQG
ncbi:hypothetical protein ACA910_019084 [Epithemia clementina (nom. ined.)]